MTRRHFIQLASTAAPLLAAAGERPATPAGTRGVVLYPFDLSLSDWPERAHRAGLNTIGLHAARRFDVLRDFITSREGRRFQRACDRAGIAVEFELHAMGELLSRELFLKDPTLFRMDERGNRTPDANCCPHSSQSLDIIAAKAVEWARIFKPTSHRYFYWPDDGAQWCRCPKCRDFSASEQALIVENHMLRALREHDARATLAHISYSHTLPAPVKVAPAPGIFVEFAPISRDYAHPINRGDAPTRNTGDGPDPRTNDGYLRMLEANLMVFGADTAQVLEYWLDVSLFSRWTRPAVRLPWNAAICRSDIAQYRKLGVRNITSFATFLDADYVRLHGDPQPVLDEYGACFR